jgi:hypothetical protein
VTLLALLPTHEPVPETTSALDPGHEWTLQAKRAFSRRDYVALHTRCKTLTGIPFKIQAVRVEGDTATVRLERASLLFAYTLRYVGGRWYFQPDAENRADYALGLERLVRKRHAEGSCL